MRDRLPRNGSLRWWECLDRVRAASGSVPAASLVNFTMGTAALAIAYGVVVASRGTPTGGLPTALVRTNR